VVDSKHERACHRKNDADGIMRVPGDDSRPAWLSSFLGHQPGSVVSTQQRMDKLKWPQAGLNTLGVSRTKFKEVRVRSQAC
jgi:hypothetical protein